MFGNKKLQQYVTLLKEYNELINIYSKKSYDALEDHILDSKYLATLIDHNGTHVDLGSGSGLPGVILAIFSSANIICVESKEKKRTFLNYVKEALDLNNLHVFDGDVQLFAKCYSGLKIESLSAKAFAKPPKLLNYLSLFHPHQVQKGASCWVPISNRQVEVLRV